MVCDSSRMVARALHVARSLSIVAAVITPGAGLRAQGATDGVSRVCEAIVVNDQRVAVSQFLSLTLLDRDSLPRESLSGSDRRTAQALLEVLRPRLAIAPPSEFPSTPLSVVAPFATTRKGSPVAVPDISTTLDVYFHRDGRLTGAQLGRVSARPSADTLLWRSVQGVASSDTLARLGANVTKDSIGIRLVTSIEAEPSKASVRVLLHEVRLPSFTQTLVVMAPGTKGPAYPPDLRSRGITGSVLFQYYVDARGRADVSTFRALRSSDPQFTREVIRAVQVMQFHPATIDGCGVRQLVQQPFNFYTR